MSIQNIRAFTFAPFPCRGDFAQTRARESLCLMKQRTGATHVIFAPRAEQATPYCEKISWASGVSDDELRSMILHAQQLGLTVFLKPTVNCSDGVWRAHIHCFDVDVPCEPKWSNWFAAYTAFQLHYARIAEETGCAMFLAGCEMVGTEHREAEWRRLIADIRSVYRGPVSYNTDKYQEGHVQWWDAVDVISSSGYYPLSCWEQELDRIEIIVRRFGKPFFFAETGCMSVHGAGAVPNDWEVQGTPDETEQAGWYAEMLKACSRRPWISGIALWDWPADLGHASPYSVCGKEAEAVIRRYFSLPPHVASPLFPLSC